MSSEITDSALKKSELGSLSLNPTLDIFELHQQLKMINKFSELLNLRASQL